MSVKSRLPPIPDNIVRAAFATPSRPGRVVAVLAVVAVLPFVAFAMHTVGLVTPNVEVSGWQTSQSIRSTDIEARFYVFNRGRFPITVHEVKGSTSAVRVVRAQSLRLGPGEQGELVETLSVRPDSPICPEGIVSASTWTGLRTGTRLNTSLPCSVPPTP
jgi:hypothetical protein